MIWLDSEFSNSRKRLKSLCSKQTFVEYFWFVFWLTLTLNSEFRNKHTTPETNTINFMNTNKIKAKVHSITCDYNVILPELIYN